jgi:hypothetical protein
MGERIGVYRVLVGKPVGRGPLGKPRLRRDDNIKRNLQEVGCGGMDKWRALVNVVMNLRVPYNAGNFLSSRELVSF